MSDPAQSPASPTPPSRSTPSPIAVALGHPLAAVIVGFVLTGVVGTTLTNHFNDLRLAEAEAVRMRDARRTAVREMSKALSERLLRMEMICSGIMRHSPKEVIADLKKAHEEAEAKWYLARPEVFMLAREVIGEGDFETIRSEMENRMVRKRLLPLRETLQQACAKVAAGDDGAALLKEARAVETLNELQVGVEAITDALFDLSSITHLNESDPQAIRVRQRVKQQVEKACP